MKKTVSFLIIALILCASCITSSAEQSYSWYMKRRGNNTPIFPDHAQEIEQYNAYFVGKSGEKKLYLTFDCGYENGNVERILDVLKEKDVPAAFFILDNIILKNTDLVRRMSEDGHIVCNHTKNHKDLSFATDKEVEKNLKALEMIYEEKCGNEIAKYFRFPEGKYSISALKAVQKMGYKTIFWSFAYDDWDNARQPNAERSIKKIMDNTHDGAIFLFHPTSSTNAEILPTLIDSWRQMGYDFGTLDELTSIN